MNILGKIKKSRIVLWGVGILFFLFPFIVAEFAARQLLVRWNEPPKPFLFDTQGLSQSINAMQQDWGDSLVVSYLDPQLGFAHDTQAHPLLGNPPGFVVYKPSNITSTPCSRIIALGGSTTDPLTALFLKDAHADYDNPYNWPKSLQQVLEARGICAEVYNGGVAGYSSSQDLLKLVRDALPLHPDLVIFLQGVNDAGFAHALPGHPMVHPYQKQFLESVTREHGTPLLPNVLALFRLFQDTEKRLVKGYSMGPEVQVSPAEHWARNARLADAIVRASEAMSLVVLQPVLGVGAYTINDAEERLLRERGEKYLKGIREFYAAAQPLCHDMPFTLDLTNVFENTAGVYLDPRHQNLAGVEVLSEAIANTIEARGLLNRNKVEKSTQLAP